MATKIRMIFLTGFFIFGLVTDLQAQDKYEYAVVTVDGFKIQVISHSREKFPIDKADDFDVALIIKVEEMVKEGWEVFNTAPIFSPNGAVQSHVYYLRKKV